MGRALSESRGGIAWCEGRKGRGVGVWGGRGWWAKVIGSWD